MVHELKSVVISHVFTVRVTDCNNDVGGAGGKGVWGKPGLELEETGTCNDVRDPNYDSDSQVNSI